MTSKVREIYGLALRKRSARANVKPVYTHYYYNEEEIWEDEGLDQYDHDILLKELEENGFSYMHSQFQFQNI